jgi:hypothetical protein
MLQFAVVFKSIDFNFNWFIQLFIARPSPLFSSPLRVLETYLNRHIIDLSSRIRDIHYRSIAPFPTISAPGHGTSAPDLD